MHTINNKQFSISNNGYFSSMPMSSDNWLKVHQLTSRSDIPNELAHICEQFHNSKGWILMVNPENELVEQLAEFEDLDFSRVLRVAPYKRPINIDKIKETLLRGNCSVVVLCDTHFTEDEMQLLLACAEKGNTHCIVLNETPKLH